MQCKKCKDRYQHYKDLNFIRYFGSCIHCVYETNNYKIFVAKASLLKYPLNDKAYGKKT